MPRLTGPCDRLVETASSRARVLAAAVLASALATLPVAVGMAGAQQPPAAVFDFQGVASAWGVRVAAGGNSLPLGARDDVGGPVAQARHTSAGISMAFASFPYPGGLGISAPGTAGGAAGTPLPDYPFYVQTRHPSTSSGEHEAGPLALRAESTERESHAVATFAGGSGGVRLGEVTSSASVMSSEGDDVVTARAEALVDAVHVEDVLRLTGVEVTARVTHAAGAVPEVEAELTIGRATVLGQPVQIGAEGLVGGVDVDPLRQALADAGVEVYVLEASEDDDGAGVVAPRLEIVVRTDSTGQQTAESIAIGVVNARVGGAVFGSGEQPGASPDPTVSGGEAASGFEAQDSGSPGPAVAGARTNPVAEAIPAAPLGDESAGGASPEAAAPQPAPAQVISQGRDDFSATNLYPMLGLGALIVVLGSAAIGRFGVKSIQSAR